MGGTLTTKIVVVCDSNLVVCSSVDKSGESFQTTSGRNVAGKMVNVRRVIPRAGRTFQHARGKRMKGRWLVELMNYDHLFSRNLEMKEVCSHFDDLNRPWPKPILS